MLQLPTTLKISLTDKAAEKVRVAMEKQGKHDAGLRLYVSSQSWVKDSRSIISTLSRLVVAATPSSLSNRDPVR